MTQLSSATLDLLAANADSADSVADWPKASWEALRQSGALAWSVPKEYGGTECTPIELLRGSEEIASACLTTAFILSQREAAVRQMLKGPSALKDRYLPDLSSGRQFLTIGVSQLTTSQQHRGPALRATPTQSSGYILDGDIPWVTGADRASAIVVGATLPDASQLLVVLPTDRPGVTIELPMTLAALVGSRTSSVRCDRVAIEPELILNGPTEHVLGKLGGGGLETSCLALGVAGAATAFLRREAAERPALAKVTDAFESSILVCRAKLHRLAREPSPDTALELRISCTKLALRSTQAGLLAAKGTGFVAPHPAQRWARQALFFLVWSCPRPVADGVLEALISEGR